MIGERLREFRESKKRSIYAVARKGNIRIDQAKAVEEGITNYTVDTFIGYIVGSDLNIYFEENDQSGLMELLTK
mgnify:FL=1